MNKKLPPENKAKAAESQASSKKFWLGLLAAFVLYQIFSGDESKTKPVVDTTKAITAPSTVVTSAPLIQAPTSPSSPPENASQPAKDLFDSWLQAAPSQAAMAANILSYIDPEKYQKDINSSQQERLSSENDKKLLASPDFKVSNSVPLTFHDAANIVANAYYIDAFEAEKEGDYLNIAANPNRLFYSQSGNQYRVVPKLNIEVSGKRYLIYDRLKRDGNYTDCHACTTPVSAIQYHLDQENIVIDHIYESFAKLGVWGNSGILTPVTFSDGSLGFAVMSSTLNQGYTSGWIDAFQITSNGILQVPELSKNYTEPPVASNTETFFSTSSIQAVNIPTNAPTEMQVSELEQLQQKASSGDAEAQFSLGLLYDVGESSFTQDYIKAAEWYQRAAAQGFAKAQHNLGVLYHDGQGVPKNYEQCYFWMVLASKSGDTKSIVLRDQVERSLTSDQVKAVQEKALHWEPGMLYTNKPLRKASFDCGHAKLPYEILICGDSELAALDKSVGDNYSKVRNRASNKQEKNQLLKEQRDFLKNRLESCKVPVQPSLTEDESKNIITCFKKQYIKRLNVLKELAADTQ